MGLAKIYACTKFEVSSFTRSKDGVKWLDARGGVPKLSSSFLPVQITSNLMFLSVLRTRWLSWLSSNVLNVVNDIECIERLWTDRISVPPINFCHESVSELFLFPPQAKLTVTVSQKVYHQTHGMTVTSSNLNRFSKFFYHWKEKEISYQKKKPWTIFEFTIFVVMSINERRSKSEKASKVIAPFCAACLAVGIGWTTASLTVQLTSGVSVFAHVWKQMLDTLSNFCDNNNIHSAVWMKLSFFDKYGMIFTSVSYAEARTVKLLIQAGSQIEAGSLIQAGWRYSYDHRHWLGL